MVDVPCRLVQPTKHEQVKDEGAPRDRLAPRIRELPVEEQHMHAGLCAVSSISGIIVNEHMRPNVTANLGLLAGCSFLGEVIAKVNGRKRVWVVVGKPL